jgi:hypothetical protein
MKLLTGTPLPVQAWYGLPAEIAVENGLWHLVRVGGVALSHPPVVNLILRRGLPEADRLHLSFLHEFGHLQTLPVALAHALLLFSLRPKRRRGPARVMKTLAAAFLAHEAVWELASELYVVANTGEEYRQIYRKHPNPGGQLVFWIGMGFLATVCTLGVLRRNQTT